MCCCSEMNGNILDRSEVEALLQSVVKEENVIDAELKLSGGSEKGDGYLSFITKVDVEGKNKDLHLVIKCAPRNEEFRRITPLRLCYLREIMFYDTIMPAFQKFQDEKNVLKPFNSVAKCYKTVEDEGVELLVLENIRENGYGLWNRMKCMDDAHISLVLKEYGRFHAISYAMRDQCKERYENLIQDITEVFRKENFDMGMFEVFGNSFQKIKCLFSEEEEKDIRDQLEKCESSLMLFLTDMDKKKTENSIITHGDCWCNNMMFKYQDESNPHTPTNVCLLDFQVVRIASPVMDLAYFMYVSSPKEVLDNLDHYLKIYYDSLLEHLQSLGSKPEKAISFEALKYEWKMYGRFGFIMSLVLFKAMLSEKDEIINFADIAETGMNVEDVFTRKLKNEHEINEKYRILVKHLYNNEFLD